MTRRCGMCDRATNSVSIKWYRYDNGQQFMEWVCGRCEQLHSKLIKAGGN